MYKKEDLKKIALYLHYDQGHGPVAIVEAHDIPEVHRIYLAKAPEFEDSQKANKVTDLPPYSPVVNLIQSMFDAYGTERSHAIFKSGNVQASYPLTAMCRGMIDLMTTGDGVLYYEGGSYYRAGAEVPPFEEVDIGFPSNEHLAGFKVQAGPDPTRVDLANRDGPASKVHRIYMLAAFALATRRFSNKQAPPPGKNIASVLVSKRGKILAFGINTADGGNPTHHGEVNTLQSYYLFNKSSPPSGSVLFTTLKPCKMCAGMIRSSGKELSDTFTYYGQFDPGSNADKTALNDYHMERPLSMAGVQGIPKEHHKWLPYPMNELAQGTVYTSNPESLRGINLRVGGGRENLTARLQAEYESFRQGAGGDTVAAWLSTEEGAQLLSEASRSLGTKARKQRDSQEAPGLAGCDRTQTQVEEALAHVMPFLRHVGVTIE